MPEQVVVKVNGRGVRVPAGTTVAAAAARAGSMAMRRSVTGQFRGALCGVGMCYECRVTVNGQPHQRGCLVECRAGMEIRTDE